MIACPHCGYLDSRVRETKIKRVEDAIVRYRTCRRCHADFPTQERTLAWMKDHGWNLAGDAAVEAAAGE